MRVFMKSFNKLSGILPALLIALLFTMVIQTEPYARKEKERQKIWVRWLKNHIIGRWRQASSSENKTIKKALLSKFWMSSRKKYTFFITNIFLFHNKFWAKKFKLDQNCYCWVFSGEPRIISYSTILKSVHTI